MQADRPTNKKRRAISEAAPAAPAPAPTLAAAPKPPHQNDKPLGQAERHRRNAVKREAGMAVLQATYPTLFDPAKPVPLALGITKQLTAAKRAGTLMLATIPMRLALGGWVRSDGYIAALAAGGFRMGLDGQKAEPVSPEHRAVAAATIKKRQAKRKPAEAG
jgi:sRNA-binding protein